MRLKPPKSLTCNIGVFITALFVIVFSGSKQIEFSKDPRNGNVIIALIEKKYNKIYPNIFKQRYNGNGI